MMVKNRNKLLLDRKAWGDCSKPTKLAIVIPGDTVCVFVGFHVNIRLTSPGLSLPLNIGLHVSGLFFGFSGSPCFLAKHSSKKNTQKPSRTPSNNISFQYVTMPHLPTAILANGNFMSLASQSSAHELEGNDILLHPQLHLPGQQVVKHTSEVEKSVDREVMGIFALENMKMLFFF